MSVSPTSSTSSAASLRSFVSAASGDPLSSSAFLLSPARTLQETFRHRWEIYVQRRRRRPTLLFLSFGRPTCSNQMRQEGILNPQSQQSSRSANNFFAVVTAEEIRMPQVATITAERLFSDFPPTSVPISGQRHISFVTLSGLLGLRCRSSSFRLSFGRARLDPSFPFSAPFLLAPQSSVLPISTHGATACRPSFLRPIYETLAVSLSPPPNTALKSIDLRPREIGRD